MEARNLDVRTIIATNIRKCMADKNLSRRKVSEDLGIKYTTLCDWVKGNSTPKPEALEKLGTYFGIQVSDFYIDFDRQNTGLPDRLFQYAMEGKILDMSILDNLNDAQLKELLKNGFRFKHKTLEEYISERGGVLKASEEFDWGEPVGRELW